MPKSRQQKRIEAEARQKAYAALTLKEKLATAGAKVKQKLLSKEQKSNGDSTVN